MEPDSNCSVGTSELPLKNPMPPLRRSPPSPPNPHIPSAKLISFPNVDVFGKLTTNQLNVLIFQYFQAKGFKHAAFAFENEAKIEKIPIDESTIGNGALPSFVHKGLRYTQLEANIHAGEGELLAIGSFDGLASIWSKNGWNSKGDFFLTGYDNKIVVWDTRTWKSKQEVAFHSAAS
ncbi:WD40 repeat-containing protein HOS15-like isoform X2 [Dioscorea cayenensis subsp. rotundata]|uniref:WD40 repeat-containing protein HOS15-like isoform X2 n=1 Tax=Dioscorea cayennensis subsp. rotundata TaxID=55577 RepID=A0AB40CB95_DIOCR|nr:WD40 repeat-containing protein HOS15-like isoform X2 [Dioscorea cayenensis subsp. rotundata]